MENLHKIIVLLVFANLSSCGKVNTQKVKRGNSVLNHNYSERPAKRRRLSNINAYARLDNNNNEYSEEVQKILDDFGKFIHSVTDDEKEAEEQIEKFTQGITERNKNLANLLLFLPIAKKQYNAYKEICAQLDKSENQIECCKAEISRISSNLEVVRQNLEDFERDLRNHNENNYGRLQRGQERIQTKLNDIHQNIKSVQEKLRQEKKALEIQKEVQKKKSEDSTTDFLFNLGLRSLNCLYNMYNETYSIVDLTSDYFNSAKDFTHLIYNVDNYKRIESQIKKIDIEMLKSEDLLRQWGELNTRIGTIVI